MQQEGLPADQVREQLADLRRMDRSFGDGSILGSMCTAPHELAAFAHGLFLETNLGDPDHFPGAKRMEREVLADLADLLHGEPAAGRFLTGGTEANLFALYIAREATGKRTVVLGEHAHFSFEKAARLLGMQLRWIPTGADHRADVAAMSAAMDDETALVVGVAGGTELGLVDDIASLAAAASAASVRCHVDAAFGGYVLPFTDAAPFDFAVPGVTSVSLDPHKGGMATIPAGVLFTRDAADWDAVAVDTPYVSTDRQSQLLGTRPGAAAAATWAVHRALGRTGYERVVSDGLSRAKRLASRLTDQGYRLVAEPETTVVTFHADDAAGLAARLDGAGIRVNVVPRFHAIRIVVNPHVDDAAIDRLLEALD